MYDRTTVQGATFNMRGQMYRGLVVQWSVQKKMQAPLLGLVKSIY